MEAGSGEAGAVTRYITNDNGEATVYAAEGMIEAVEYVHDLDFIDQSRIGVTGHSHGGNVSSITTQYFRYLDKYGEGNNLINSAFIMAGSNGVTVPENFVLVNVGFYIILFLM